MTVTIVSRWKVTDVAEATKNAKLAKSLWSKHGALDCRLNALFTGPHTGQMIFASVFPDMAAYGRASESIRADTEWMKLQDDIRKFNKDHGDRLEERAILVGVDI